MNRLGFSLNVPLPFSATGHGAVALVLAAAALGGCDGAQSSLQPAGPQADAVATLWWLMFWGAVVVLTLVMALALLAAFRPPDAQPRPTHRLLFIVGGGLALPIVSLSALLVYGHTLGAPPAAPDTSGLRVNVSAERFWWRFSYPQQGGIQSAGVLHLPVDETVELTLASGDVIHSFWVPRLGGKRDVVPGRTTRIRLRADQSGVFRGQCAEFCGSEHARMSFLVVAQPRAAFDAWLAAQARPAAEPEESLPRQGREAFLAADCGDCHRLRGTRASGSAGPDLTHMGSRWRLRQLHTPEASGGIGPGDDLMSWILRAHAEPPWVAAEMAPMPPEQQLRAIAAYLEGLQ